MKKYLIISIVVLLAALGAAVKRNVEINNKWKVAQANVKAYDALLSNANSKSTAFQLTIDQLKTSKDSIFEKLDSTRKALKIRDKNVKALQYVTSTFTITDTVVMRDTIFKEPSLKIDTVIGDKWYNVKIGLRYPSTVAVSPQFKSEKHIVVSLKKETVNPPKKFWLFRLFQKKHKVLKVDVVEQNPYVKDEKSRYVEILK